MHFSLSRHLGGEKKENKSNNQLNIYVDMHLPQMNPLLSLCALVSPLLKILQHLFPGRNFKGFLFLCTLESLCLWVELFFGGLELEAASPSSNPAPPPEVHSRDAQLNGNNDHGFWMFYDTSHPLKQTDFSISTHFEFRWGSDYRLFWFQGYNAMLVYDLTKKLKESLNTQSDRYFHSCTVGTGCSQISRIAKNTKGIFKWVWICRTQLDFNIGFQWHHWKFLQRLRSEYIDYYSKHYKDFAGVRYRLGLIAPWKFTCLNVSPYVHNEFFFRPNTYSKSHPNGLVGGFHQNRLRIGLGADIEEGTWKPEIWWQWWALKQKPGPHPLWFNTYQWGADVTLRF
jgi:hypothetical protein